MAEHLDVSPERLRQVAQYHRDTAEELRAVPAGNAHIMSCLESLGPVFAELRDAGRELLDQRKSSYERQAAAHDDLAARLDHAARTWEQHDNDAAEELRAVTRDLR